MTSLHMTDATIQTAISIKSQLPLPHFTFRARRQHLFPYDARILLPLFKITDTPMLTEREREREREKERERTIIILQYYYDKEVILEIHPHRKWLVLNKA